VSASSLRLALSGAMSAINSNQQQSAAISRTHLELEVGVELRHVGVRVIVRRAPVQIEAKVLLLEQDAADVGHLMRGAIIRNQAGNQ
jgi:hypothetical protein